MGPKKDGRSKKKISVDVRKKFYEHTFKGSDHEMMAYAARLNSFTTGQNWPFNTESGSVCTPERVKKRFFAANITFGKKTCKKM